MKLIIFPGAADPHTTYKDAYDLLRKEAKRRKLTEFILQNYPGHYSYDDNSYLSMSASVNLIRSSIRKLELKKEQYIVVCRSFGCLPFIEFLKLHTNKMIHVKKVILWGCSPYHLWYSFFKDFDPNVFRDKNVRVKPGLFKSIYPVELSINEISNTASFNTFITSGDQDHYHPVYFQELLKAINKNPKVVLPDLVKGEGHTITRYNKKYFDLIF